MTTISPVSGTVIGKTDKTQLRIALSDFTGKSQVDIRTYVKTAKSEDFIPTRKGISFDPAHLDKVIAALTELKQQLPRKVVRYAVGPDKASIKQGPFYKKLEDVPDGADVGDFIFRIAKLAGKTSVTTTHKRTKKAWAKL